MEPVEVLFPTEDRLLVRPQKAEERSVGGIILPEQAQEHTVKVSRDDDGSLFAQILELPGCFASGDDMDELEEGLKEALGLYLSTEHVRSRAAKSALGSNEERYHLEAAKAESLCAIAEALQHHNTNTKE